MELYSHINENSFIPVSIIASRLADITDNNDIIVDVLSNTNSCILSDDKLTVKPNLTVYMKYI